MIPESPLSHTAPPAGRLSLLRRSIAPLWGLSLFALPVRAQQPKVLTLDDYPRWSRVTDVQLSADGRWMSYGYSPNEGDGTLYIKDLAGTTIHTIARASGPVFSDDSRWVTYTIHPPGASAGRGGRGGGRGAAPPAAGRGNAGAGDAARALELLDLQSGSKFEVPDPQSSAFAANSRFLVVRRNRANRDTTHDGTDLIVRNLADGTVQNIGNVSEYAFNDAGTLLAWTVDAAGKAGNGVYVMDPANGSVRPLDTDTLEYGRLTWNGAGTALAVLRGETPAGAEQRVNTLVAFTGLGGSTAARSRSASSLSGSTQRFVYDPSQDAQFPRDMVLSELGAVSWSRDGARIFFGIREQREKVETKAGEERANVEIWHWADERLQSVQKVRLSADQRSTDAAAINLATRRFVRIGDDSMQRTDVAWDGRSAVAHIDAPYRMIFDEPDGLRDVVKIDLANGERKPLLERVRYTIGSPPDGRYLLYSIDGSLRLLDTNTGSKTDLSALAGADFMNHDADRPGEKPTLGIAGWSRDGRTVIVNAEYDLWSIPLDGRPRAVNLTRGAGARDMVRLRVTSFADDDDEDQPGIDTSKPMMLSAYGDRTKKSGYWILEPGTDPRPLIWQDRAIGQARKAKSADRVVFTSQTFEEFPDWYMTDARFANATRVTDANPQQKEYGWGRRVLVDYADARGHDLQATLTLPAGYEPGKKYPMLVYFYEKLSQNHHQYSMPTYDDRPHMSTYASNGYLVLMPDIVYDDGKPGSSALDDVTSAVRKVIELGYADPAHIGAQGHSWGGYESSFIVTQTDMFAAVVTGAPLTNLESMHNILYKQSGGGNAPLIQWGQGRMGTVPWLDPEGYASQSPVRFVENITSPFMILHGTADGAVDYNQGLEFYVAARRAGKKVILLTYPDEPHHLAKKENQKDFQVRMKEFFDHYLKGAPAPSWMTRGVDYLDRDRVIVTDGNTIGTGGSGGRR